MGCSNSSKGNEYEEEKSDKYYMPGEKTDPNDIYKYNPISKSNSKSNIKGNKIDKTKKNGIKNIIKIKHEKKSNNNTTVINVSKGKAPLNKVNNQINFVLEIKKGKFDKKDFLDKEIYFLDNKYYVDNSNCNKVNEGLRELNQSNAELVINRVKYPFQKYFKFREEGEYNISLNLKVAITDCSNMFYGSKYLKSVDFTYFCSEYVNYMVGMFNGCQNLKYVNLTKFNVDNVIDMSYMFNNCTKLTNVNLSLLDTHYVNDMSYMFRNCESLTNVNLYNLNTESVTDMSHMFDFCSKLSNLDITSLNTQNVTNMSHMFHSCLELTEIDLSKLNTTNVSDMSSMFENCSGLKSIDMSSLDTKNVTNMESMFSGCFNLSNILMPYDTQSVTNINLMFNDCKRLTMLDLSFLEIKNIIYARNIFKYCSNLKKIILNNDNYSVIERALRWDEIEPEIEVN